MSNESVSVENENTHIHTQRTMLYTLHEGKCLPPVFEGIMFTKMSTADVMM